MIIDILTLFPEMFKGVFEHSIIARGIKNKIIKINLHNLRDWAIDKHTRLDRGLPSRGRKTVDDSPYGGGAGMVLKVDVIDKALRDLKFEIRNSKFETNLKLSNRKNSKHISDLVLRASNFQNQPPHIVLLTPQGKPLNQQLAQKLATKKRLILVCGHYEGFDERVRKLVDEEISIGQYVLTGGEIPAMVITDAITRLLPGILGKDESSQEESFSMEEFLKSGRQSSVVSYKSLLEYPHYTRPKSYTPISKKYKLPLKVPKILLSGNHGLIKDWRIDQSVKKSNKKFLT